MMVRLFLVLWPALAAACGAAPAAPPAGDTPPPDPFEITADGPLLERLTIGEPTNAAVAASQTVAARIDVDRTRVTRVGSPVMGRVSRLAAEEGQHVRQGDLLALLDSTGLSDAQLAFLKALSDRQLAQRAAERAKLLLAAEVIGAAERQRRDAELAQAQAEFDAARDQLAVLGMPAAAIDELERTHRINSVSRVVASMDGTVLHRMVSLGQVIQPADTAFEIADLSSVWLVADVPEQNAGHLTPGLRVEASVAALPGLRVEGTLSFVSATVNEETRTVQVRMALPNPDRRFKPAMLATVTLKDAPAMRRVVPTAAIVRDGDREGVFVQRDRDTFVLRPVSLGPEYGSQRVLEDGLAPGERIVLDGAFHLNNERRRRLVRGSQES